MSTKLTIEQIRAIAVKIGFPDPDTIAAICMAESGGDPEAVGDRHLGVSCGLAQISLRWHAEWNKPGVDICDPTTNLQAAFGVSHGGTVWEPWSTYRNGAFKRYMPATPPPDPAATPVPATEP